MFLVIYGGVGLFFVVWACFIVGHVIGVAHSSFVCVSCMISTACLNVIGKFVQKRSASMSKGGLPHECPSSVRMDGHDYFVISRDSVEAIEALMGN